MFYRRLLTVLFVTLVAPTHPLGCFAEDATKAPITNPSTPSSEASSESNPGSETTPAEDPRYAKLKSMLNNVALIGMFTIDKKPMRELKEERYEIKSIEKMPGDNELWALEARIKYGKHDVTLPIVVTMKWAGDTPVIVMDKLLIPGLGTFSSRVVFHDRKYAGTWIHDENGGHLFGRIEPLQ